MKHILTQGEVSLLFSDEGGGALSGEVHLVKHKKDKYVVRKCPDLRKAKGYEKISKEFEKYGFFPKLIGRFGKDVLYEYIEGRDLRKNERPWVFGEIGKIAAHINKIKVPGIPYTRFNIQLNELVTGNFRFSPKVYLKRKRIKSWKKPKPILSEQEAKEIRRGYRAIKAKCNPTMALDANDLNPSNFRLGKDKKIYFVDIEAIKPRVKGFGIGKGFLRWARTPAKKEAFFKGYSSVSSIKFLTPEYMDFIYLNFLLQKVNYNVNVFQSKSYEEPLNSLNEILEKYR